MAMDPTRTRTRPFRGSGLATFAALALGLGALCSCFKSDGISQLFGDETTGGGGAGGGQGGFDPGLGGGVILRDLFQGARIEQTNPTVKRTYPADSDRGVNVKTVIALEFSESIDAQSALGGIRVFSQGSNTSTPGTLQLFQGQTVVLFTPNADLAPSTTYEIAVSNSVTDLQGKQVQTGGSSSEMRTRFTTQAATDDPGFKVGLSSPSQSQGNVTRGAQALIFFSEPVNSTLGPAGLMTPGNITVDVDGARLVRDTHYTQTAIGGATLMGVQIEFISPTLLAASADVDIRVSKNVETVDGRHTLAGGDGFRLLWTAQNAMTPNDILFPNSFALVDADGFVARPNLNSFLADVALTADGQGVDDVTLIFFDQAQENALVFVASGGNPLSFNVNLQPDANTPAFGDGDILVGAYIRNRTFRSEVSVLRILRKDTIGPLPLFLGPASVQVGSTRRFFSYVNDPILYGRMDEPCQGIQLEFNQSGVADFSSIQFAAGLSTVTDDFFFTGPTRDGPLDPRLEPYASFAVIATDQFGNGNTDLFPQLVSTVGVTGASWLTPDGSTALLVSATDGGDFTALGSTGSNTWGMVVVEPFPPDPTGANQVVKGLQESLGLVRFTAAELPATPQMTVTVVANDAGSPTKFWNPVTYAGLDTPTALNPTVLLPLLQPSQAPAGQVVRVTFAGGIAGSSTTVGASQEDLDAATAQKERVIGLNSGDQVPFAENRPQVIAGIETVTGGDQRFTATPAFAEGVQPVSGGGGGGQLTPEQVLDFTGRGSFNSATPNLARNVDFSNDDVTVGGALGLLGTEVSQFRRARLLVRAPGLVVPVPVSMRTGAQFLGFNDMLNPARTATVLKPSDFLVNDSVGSTGREDSALELFLQPSLADPNDVVDSALQDSLIRTELHIEDVTDGANPSSAFTRQRFFTGVATQTATFQTVPTITSPTMAVTHPPQIDWPEVTSGTNAVHALNLFSSANGRTWTMYVPAGVLGDPVQFQVPLIPSTFVDASGSGSRAVDFQFGNPGTFGAWVESYDFAPATGTATYQFDLDAFYQSDLEREHFLLSRSDTNFTITTIP